MPNGKKHKRHKMATHKRKKRLRKNRHTGIRLCPDPGKNSFPAFFSYQYFDTLHPLYFFNEDH